MAENTKKDAVASIEAMEEHVNTWRWTVKTKQRGIFSFDELVAIKLKELKKRIYTDVEMLKPWKMRECIFKDVGEYEYLYDGWKDADVGDSWGGEGLSAFFKNSVDIPERFKGKKVTLNVYFGGDSLLSLNGVPYQGLDPFRNSVLLTECAQGNEHYDIDIESYFVWHSNEATIKKIECSFVATVDPEIEDVFWDIKAVYNALFMPVFDEAFAQIIRESLKEALRYVDFDTTDINEFKAGLKKCKSILKEKVYDNKNYASIGKLALVGNSHLDVVFMWAYKEFVRKLGRTHATMLRLMEQYPDFIFSQSQSVMYEEMKENFPDLFEQVKKRIEEGRWEYIGGMWVEPDCNIISGESFVRQFLHGIRYAEETFGVTPKTCWLPDVFGNSYAMPQIMKMSGIKYFVTHKMGIWNDTNPWQYNSFWWEGPDGSKVFSIVPPTHFIGSMEADSLKMNWDKYTDKTTIGESMYCYGWGDGGGGVDTEMLEYVKRYRKFPGLPETQTSTIEDSLARMKEKATDDNIVTWKDELYLEAHRGVYTTKGMLKKLNRYCENLMREVEIYSSIASLYGYEYPLNDINKAWKGILTNQFHDSLPGSHITEVYGDLLKQYDIILAIAEPLHKKALEVISKNICADAKNGKPFAIFNSLGENATSKVELPCLDVDVYDSNGERVATQCYTKLDGEKVLVFVAKNVPAVGYKVYYTKPADNSDKTKTFKSKEVENERFKLSFNEGAELISVYDKANNREVLSGKGNVFRLFEDIPGKYEAWDIVATYVDREFETTPGVLEEIIQGEVFTSISISKQILQSEIRQNIIIYNDIDRIDFDTYINWVERQKLLKVGFDVDLNAKSFTRDIAYATIESSNYRYNPYDKAKFEVSAHNWIDMSDEDYGLSILNDCKYGFEVDEKRMMITLLKGPLNPDPESDLGDHYFTYSLYPHNDGWRDAKTITKALELNNPMTPVEIDEGGNAEDKERSFISVNADNVTLEAVKKCEDENAYIVRLVEKSGSSTNVVLSLFADIKSAAQCDLIERNDVPFEAKGNKVEFKIKPFEIKNFKFKF
ncbi:MAG TPA: glycoside hydrolase family 38 C-terminal domain-containing protein [Clostridia bacterium]|nr:glycoside hydrolase family 38 C-terminal domain-containing protein [Clostridia bacterium]